MLRSNFIYILIICVVIAGCSMYSSNPLSTSYHNLTAHYNAYFIANERMKEIEQTVYEGYEWNYNKVLPIYVPIDSNDAKSLNSLIEDCIEKASIAIQRHEGSRWEDDSYVLVGKARYYALEYADAIETFKYVNKHGDDDDARHEALVELIKTFVDFNEINNAIVVSDYLKKEKLNNNNQKELNLVRAYLYQKRDDYDQMVKHLVLAEDLMSKFSDKARIDFIIGQVYQELGFEAEAYNFYESCLRNNPDYELSFYAKLNMAQVTQLASSGDIKKTRKYFKKLLKDTKNTEYKDKIYYEMANFEVKQGNLEKAIDHFKSSIKFSVKNQRQKAYSYWELGQIYYDSLKNFELAKAYYDSTVNTMPKDEEEFDKISQRQEVLDDFVKNLLIVRTNDSLISLSQLPRDSVLSLATTIAEKEEALKEEKKRKEEKRRANREANALDQEDAGLIGTNPAPGATWYFYNPSAVAKGSSEFKRQWGDRALEDNWRRSFKAGGDAITVAKESEAEELDPESAEAERQKRIDDKVSEMMARVPQSEEKINSMLGEVEIALYNLGNIYNFQLEEKENAISTLESLLVRFPEHENKAEVLYTLYLLYKDRNPEVASDKEAELKNEFPDSIYAKLIDNPNYREESQQATEQLKFVYNKAYLLYDQGKYKESKYLLDSALKVYPENKFSDNLKLLSVLAIGQLEGQYKYQFELNNFIKENPESELVSYAQNLVTASEEYQINLYNSSKARFVQFFNQKHYLVVVYPNEEELTEKLPSAVETYLNENQSPLTSGNLILDENHAMVLINDFSAREAAEAFLTTFNEELDLKDQFKGKKIYRFVITEDNFDIFYQTKDLNAYLNFFEKNYL